MSHPAAFDHVLAAWNEKDLEKIRAHLDLALAPGVVFCDPDNLTSGPDEFEAMVRAFRSRIPEAVCERTSGLDSHHDLFRYEWAVRSEDSLLVHGFDVARVDENGRLLRIDGFFGPLPPIKA
jgi:hypothetical protein